MAGVYANARSTISSRQHQHQLHRWMSVYNLSNPQKYVLSILLGLVCLYIISRNAEIIIPEAHPRQTRNDLNIDFVNGSLADPASESKLNSPTEQELRRSEQDQLVRPRHNSTPRGVRQEGTKTLEFRMPNRTIAGDSDTHYFCSLIKLPDFAKKYQAVASKPLVNEANKDLIHHIVLYICTKSNGPPDVNTDADCGPTGNNSMMSHCQLVLGGWTMGDQELWTMAHQPRDVGLPFTPEMSGLYVALQIHYHNSKRRTTVDDSGIQFILTDKLRPYDSGTVITGVLALDWTLALPPKSDSFTVRSKCSKQCTTKRVPGNGVYVFASSIHMHSRGKSATARHFRGSQEISPALGEEAVYVFGAEHSQPIEPPRKFLPGDRIVVECNFTTAKEETPIFGGEGASEEMCMVFLSYYPKTDMIVCGSVFKVEPFLNVFGSDSARSISQEHFQKIRSEIGLNNKGQRNKLRMRSLTEPLGRFLTDHVWDNATIQGLDRFYLDTDEANQLDVCL